MLVRLTSSFVTVIRQADQNAGFGDFQRKFYIQPLVSVVFFDARLSCSGDCRNV